MNKYALFNLMESLTEAGAFELFFNQLEELRKEKPEQFINTILTYIEGANEKDFNYLFHRLKLSEEEDNLFYDTWLAILTKKDKLELRRLLISRFQKQLFHLARIGEVGTDEFRRLENVERRKFLQSVELTEEEIINLATFTLDRKSIEESSLLSIQLKFSKWNAAGLLNTSTTEPSAEQLFASFLEKLRKEKPSWRESDFLRYDQRRIKSHFKKETKPFTEQDVRVGAEWYNNARKKISEEKQKKDSRSRSRVNVPRKKWREFYQMRFGTEKPEFTREFEKKVRREAARLQNIKTAPNRAK
jgi:hypothetical protein